MWASQSADPVVCAIVFAATAVLVLVLSRLVRRAKEVVKAAPPMHHHHHHHYSGPVTQDSRIITTRTSGEIDSTRDRTGR
ncbi:MULTISPECIES: hypothetical protein [unclassified Streptomyces]|uniref:hypothetical protein n=1 Tax=unclassified Streptomyces TaxID=2593676 RepID=UPI002E15F13E|nr:hypothetical protein OG452_20585 [Streptomyces sp. NBC_01197]WSS49770.1 hypothetical protein OG708_14675 [Streptomyces sp. NBC_01180]